MSGRSKGFDPLSNLFTDTPAPTGAEGEATPAAPVVESNAATDPAFDPAAAPPVPAQVATDPDAVDRVALAKQLAAEAQARVAEAVTADKALLAKKLAAEAQARVAARTAEDNKAQTDKAALAKALAKAAIAKSAGASSSTSKPKPKKSLADRAPRSISERAGAGRRMSALEAARAAAAAEAARKQASAETPIASPAPSVVADGVSGLLAGALGPDLTEEPPRLAQQRDLLTALWKAHTQRHIQDRRWNVAGACAAVVDALERVGPGQLVAVSANAGGDDLLVWFDVGRRSIVAVIPDGRNYLAGL